MRMWVPVYKEATERTGVRANSKQIHPVVTTQEH